MLAMEKLQMGQTPPYCKSAAELDGINAKVLADYADSGEPVALEAYTRCGEMLGRGVAVIVDMLNPEAITTVNIPVAATSLLEHLQHIIQLDRSFLCGLTIFCYYYVALRCYKQSAPVIRERVSAIKEHTMIGVCCKGNSVINLS
jgi:predicted NBD/HSP70 family sugar kinase